MNRREFLKKSAKTMFIFTGALWIPKYGIARMNPAIMGGSASPSGVTYLLQDAFTGEPDTYITAAGWTAVGTDPEALMKITSTGQSGTSLLINHAGNTSEYKVCRSFTQQSSGKFVVDIYYKTSTISGGTYDIVFTLDSTDNEAGQAMHLYRYEDDLAYYSGGFQTIAPAVLTIDTWYHIEVELNMDTNKYNVWFAETEYNNSENYWPFVGDYDPQYVYLYKVPSTVSNSISQVDTLNIYDGARP